MINMDNKYLNIEEARQKLKISRITLYRWIKAGKLPSTKAGSTYRIRNQDVDDFLAGKPLVAESPERVVVSPSRSPLSITARDIENWATNNRLAEEILPELIRRLLQAAQKDLGIIDLRIPSGDSIGQPGWDGRVQTTQPHPYAPTGNSAWEMGVGPAEQKANADYLKRTKNPLNVKPPETSFTFVTTRSWPEKDDWVEKKRQKSEWKDVKVIDADDLEAWIEMSPAVKYWLLGILGRNLDGIKDLETWWEDWRSEDRPPLSADLVISGREDNLENLQKKLASVDTGVISVTAESRPEALAFLAASVLSLPAKQSGAILSTALVIEHQVSWNTALGYPGPLLLVAMFDEPQELGRAISQGHRVIVPLDKASPSAEDGIILSRPKKDKVLEELKKIGVTEKECELLAPIGRHSLLSLWRRLSPASSVQSPSWLSESDTLVPALLIGKWDERQEADQAAVAKVSNIPYEEFRQKLDDLYALPDSPLGKVGSKWYVASKEDVWSLLRQKVRPEVLKRFVDTSFEILSEVDPAYTMPYEDRWLANIQGKDMKYSGEIRVSIADTLAHIAARYSDKTIGDQSGADLSSALITKLLSAANDELSGHLWASLNGVLPLLAEAAPNEFLSAIEEGIKKPGLQIGFIFQDKEDDSSFSSSSPHTGFLWALENIAWSPRFLLRATYVLCKLHEMDPGGRLSNRPIGSLKDIYLSWHHQTSADTATRIECLRKVIDKYPNLGWKLLLEILPDGHGFTTGTHKPKWQEWAPDKVTLTYGDLFKVVDAAAAILVENVDTDVKRWSEFLEHYKELPTQVQEQINQKLANAGSSSLRPEDRKILWDTVRDFVNKHKRFTKTEWAVDKEQIEKVEKTLESLEPSDPKDKYEWLFSHHVDLPVDDSGWEKHEAAVKATRTTAATELYKVLGIDQFLMFASRVESPYYLGVALGQTHEVSVDDYDIIFKHLSGQEPKNQAARGIVVGRFYPADWVWANQEISKSETLKSNPEALGMFLTHLPNSKKTWRIVDEKDEKVQRQYWENCNPLGLEDNADYVYVANKLLDYSRQYEAVEVLGGLLEDTPIKPGDNLIMRVLEESVKIDPSRVNMTMFSYYVTKLLDYLDLRPKINKSRLAQIEWQLLPLLKEERGPKVLHGELAKNPKFFVEVIEWVYRAKGSEKKSLTKVQKTRARLGHELLDSWRTIPGMKNGKIEQTQLYSWVDVARKQLEKSGRKEVGDQLIGKILSYSPTDADGIWPSLPVRNLIERIESQDIEDGFRTAVYNNRGVTSRGHGEGGNQERGLAKKYDDLAKKVESQWPRTALSLLRIADTWRREAEHHDNRAIEDELE